MRTADLITDQELRDASAIHTIDPSHPAAAGHQLWGSKTTRSQSDPENMDLHIIEVELRADDHVTLLQLIERIARLKKEFPPDVVELRKNLTG